MARSVLPRAVVGLGSSLGDRRARLSLAVRMLHARPGLRVIRTSLLYRTPPWGGVARNWFLNAAVLLESAHPARDLQGLCKLIEARLGRRPGLRWGDRVLDIDLLCMEGCIAHQPDHKVPHPRIAERPFVVMPLEDVLPGAVNPVTGRTFLEDHRALGPAAALPRAVPVGVLWQPPVMKADS